MEEDKKSQITTQDWLEFLYQEQSALIAIDQILTPRIIASATLTIISLVSIFQDFPFNILGIIGFCIGAGFCYIIIKNTLKFAKYLFKIKLLIILIIKGDLISPDKISTMYQLILISSGTSKLPKQPKVGDLKIPAK